MEMQYLKTFQIWPFLIVYKKIKHKRVDLDCSYFLVYKSTI